VRRGRDGSGRHGGLGRHQGAGNAADRANRTLERLEEEVAEILRRSAETGQREDRALGDARGDELPPALAGKAGRLVRLRQAKAQLEAEAAAREQAYQQRVAAHTTAAAAKGTRPRSLKRRPQEAPNPTAVANVTDPDSRFLHTRNGSVQGYNAQAVTILDQLVVAAALTCEANDIHQLEPMLQATAATLAAAGIHEQPEAALADSGYWSIDNLTTIPDAPQLLIPPARHGRQGKPRKDGKPSASRSDGLRAAMNAKLASDEGKARYAKRRETIEPVFAQIKEHRGARRFLVAAWPPARRSGSCCAAPTTSSSFGDTR
jgi:Transposase DDE domain